MSIVRGSYKNPLPALPVVNKAGQHWRKVATAQERETVYGDVCASFVCKVLSQSTSMDPQDVAQTYKVGYGNFTKRLNRSSKEALKYFAGNILAVSLCVRHPYLDSLEQVSIIVSSLVGREGISPLLLGLIQDTQAAFHTAKLKVGIRDNPNRRRETDNVQSLRATLGRHRTM